MTGAELIAAERTRQQAEEGYTADHDAQHYPEDLTEAAKAYITLDPRDWPWDQEFFKPRREPIENWKRAGALLAAAIDAWQRDEQGA